MKPLDRATLQAIIAEQLDGYHLVVSDTGSNDEPANAGVESNATTTVDELVAKYIRVPREDTAGRRPARRLARHTRLVATEREDRTDSSAPHRRGAVVSTKGKVVAVEG